MLLRISYKLLNYCYVTWLPWHLKSLANWLFNWFFRHSTKQQESYWSFMRGTHQWLVDSSQKGPVMRKMFPYHDVSMSVPACYCSMSNIGSLTIRHHSLMHLTYDIFKHFFFNEPIPISIKISLVHVPSGLIDKRSALVQVTSHDLNQWWLSVLTYVCVICPQWVKLISLCCSGAKPLHKLLMTLSLTWFNFSPSMDK